MNLFSILNVRASSIEKLKDIKKLNKQDSSAPEHKTLGGEIIPESYNLWLWLNENGTKVVGNVTINVRVKE